MRAANLVPLFVRAKQGTRVGKKKCKKSKIVTSGRNLKLETVRKRKKTKKKPTRTHKLKSYPQLLELVKEWQID